MTTLQIVKNSNIETNHFWTKYENQIAIAKTVRICFLFLILLSLVLLQVTQSEFINVESHLPVLVLITISFLFHSTYLLFYSYFSTNRWINNSYFVYEAVFITGLYYFTSTNHSLFLFLYLVNLVLAGMLLGRKGALTLAIWTSFLFSVLQVLAPEMAGQNTFFAVALNNIAFFSVAYLSGTLSEQFVVLDTELKAKEDDIETLKELNELIVENITTGLMTLDKEGVIQHINPSGLTILDVEEAVGRTLPEINKQLALKVGSYNSEQEEVEHRQRNRVEVELRADESSSRKIIEVIISPLFDNATLFSGYVLLLQDLTEQKDLEYQVRQQEKLAAVGQLAAGIAHEIRNPLASISGSVQLMMGSEAIESSEDKRLMNIVVREIDRLNALITEFLEFVRPDVRANDPVDVNHLLGEVLEMIKVDPRISAQVNHNPEMHSKKIILGHRDKLKQAFLNIVINACQAMMDVESPNLGIQTYDKPHSLVMVISDNGVGMSEENIKRMFEPFHTTKTNGTGLGLAITHKILESHNAKINIESELGRGTSFTLEFPTEELQNPNDMVMKKHG